MNNFHSICPGDDGGEIEHVPEHRGKSHAQPHRHYSIGSRTMGMPCNYDFPSMKIRNEKKNP